MVLHVDQTILGAVQLGECANLNDTNPYEPTDRKRYLGWQEGHKRVIAEHQQWQKHNNLSLFRKIMCKTGFHKYSLKRIPGRPHIDSKTGNINGRDSVIKKYTCDCGAVCFEGLV